MAKLVDYINKLFYLLPFSGKLNIFYIINAGAANIYLIIVILYI